MIDLLRGLDIPDAIRALAESVHTKEVRANGRVNHIAIARSAAEATAELADRFESDLLAAVRVKNWSRVETLARALTDLHRGLSTIRLDNL